MSEDPRRITDAFDWVVAYINKMEPGEWVPLDEMGAKDQELLIECIKQHIDWYHNAEFSNDYTKIKKLNYDKPGA
jgi:hypothetical protein